jgi:hypothetical protein
MQKKKKKQPDAAGTYALRAQILYAL